MTIVGELTAGTATKKETTDACRTCSAKDQPLTPAGHCWDPTACARRRIARTSKTQHLRSPCLVKIQTRGATYYLREFGPKIAPPPPILPPGFTLKDYEANPTHLYYEALMESGGRVPSDATSFKVEKALALAKMFNGTVVNK
jgi:hypothetical protein